MNGKKCWYLSASHKLSPNPKAGPFLAYGEFFKFEFHYRDGLIKYPPYGLEYKMPVKKDDDWVKDILIAPENPTLMPGGNVPAEIIPKNNGPAYASMHNGIVTAIILAEEYPKLHKPGINWRQMMIEELSKYGDVVMGYSEANHLKNATLIQ